MDLTPQTPEEHAIINSLRKMDDVQRLLFMTGIDALRSGRITITQFSAWMRDKFDRYRAGEELLVSDLELPPHPNAEGSTAGLSFPP